MLHADAYDLKTIFEKQRKHKVPLYQRRYVWSLEKQWDPLWEDIQILSEKYITESNPQPHFMGAVVLKQDETSSGEIETRLVIDGQQRLMTLQLFIAAARDVCKSMIEATTKRNQEIDTQLAILGSQSDAVLTQERENGLQIKEMAGKQHNNLDYLVLNKMGVEQESDNFKVWPTQADQEEFKCALEAASPEELRRRLPENDSRIREAYLFFYDKIDAWFKSGTELNRPIRIEAFYKALRSGIILVVIDLSKEDNAQMIFEALNARGTPLLESELVKNYLLYLCDERHLPSEEIHKNFWQSFENDSFWQDEAQQGRLFRPRIEIYLQHYLTMQLGKEVPAQDLFDAFKNYVSQNPMIGPDVHLKLLHDYGDIFHGFYQAKPDDSENLFFHRIEVMDTTTLFPLLLFVYDQLRSPQHDMNRRSLLSLLESFLVRRMICSATTKQYNKLFLDMKQHLQADSKDMVTKTQAYLLSRTADSELWPDDNQLKQAWIHDPLFRWLPRARLRMVLEALELASRTSKSEQLSLPKKTLTIEHLMPQAWQQFWPLPADSLNAENNREAHLHNIGNLTLVTSSLNPSMRNAAWEKKRPAILEHSVLKLNHYFQDKLEWNETTINDRGQQLFELALKVWPRPS